MSVAYLLMCDGDCTVQADWPTPALTGYRRALRKAGWSRDKATGKDYCPRCTRARREAARG